MRVVPLFKGPRRQPGVVLFIIRRCQGRLIHYRLNLALAVQRAVVLYAAVAGLSTCKVLAVVFPNPRSDSSQARIMEKNRMKN